jgi:hypothetical protein
MARLSKSQIQEQLSVIRQLLSDRPDGLSLEAIAKAYHEKTGATVADRTLSRRLAHLLKSGDVVSQGRGPSTTYKPAVAHTPESGLPDGYPTLTREAVALRVLVRRPLSQRVPVGYHRDWLLDYQPGKTWYLSSAERANLQVIGRTPDADRPAGTFARDILSRLLIDLSWASSRLEGNTYSRLDTQNLIEFGQRAEGKDVLEAQMILNHKTAIELLVSGADYVGFNKHTLMAVHAALSENLLSEPADEGRLRERPVMIAGSVFTPVAIPQVITECFDRIIETGSRIPDPFEQAFFAMVHIPYLQPFADVNKRTSRLAANIPLITGNVSPLSFVDVPEDAYIEGTLAVYEHRRTELLRDIFVFAYQRSAAHYRVVRESLGTPNPIRLRYRNEFIDVVRQTVLAGEPPSAVTLGERSRALGVPEQDIEVFSQTALEIVLQLHEGSAPRYGLTPNQFKNWKSRFKVPK